MDNQKNTAGQIIEAEIRIPTTQYGYISLFPRIGVVQEAITLHNNAVKAYQDSLKTPEITPLQSLDKKNLMRVMDRYLSENAMEMEDIDGLGDVKCLSQRDMFNIIRLSIARINSKYKE